MTQAEEQHERGRREYPGLRRREVAEVHHTGGGREKKEATTPGAGVGARGRETEQQHRAGPGQRRENAHGEQGIGPRLRERAENALLHGHDRRGQGQGQGRVDVGVGQDPSLPHHRGHDVGLLVGVEARGEAPADAGEVQGEGQAGGGEDQAALGHAPAGVGLRLARSVEAREGAGPDVAAVDHPVEMDPADGLVRPRDRRTRGRHRGRSRPARGPPPSSRGRCRAWWPRGRRSRRSTP